MADQGDVPGGVEEDLGEPIAELLGFEEEAPEGLFGRVVRSLRRRALGGQLTTLGWTGLGQVVLEFLKIIYTLFEPRRPDGGE